MTDFVKFCLQDTDHQLGTLAIGWLLFAGLRSLILAARGLRDD